MIEPNIDDNVVGAAKIIKESDSGISNVKKSLTVLVFILLLVCAYSLVHLLQSKIGNPAKVFMIGVAGCLFMPPQDSNYFGCVAGVTKLGVAQSQAFGAFADNNGLVSEKTSYRSIEKMAEVNGKLAYTFVRNDGTSGVVFDGKVISNAYQKVYPSYPPIDVGGDPAYVAVKNGTKDKTIAVWRGQEYGADYDSVSNITNANGTVAYRATKKESDGTVRYVLVINGSEDKTRFNAVSEYVVNGNRLAYIGKDYMTGSFVVMDGIELGPYKEARDLKNDGGHFIALARRGTENLYVFDGKEFSRSATSSYTAVVQDNLAYFDANSDLMVGKTKYASGTDTASDWIVAVGDEPGYFVKSKDQSSQLMVGKEPRGQPILGTVSKILVSDSGKIAIVSKFNGITTGVVIDRNGTVERQVENPHWFAFRDDGSLVFDIADVSKDAGTGLYFYAKAVVNGKMHSATSKDRTAYIFRQI